MSAGRTIIGVDPGITATGLIRADNVTGVGSTARHVASAVIENHHGPGTFPAGALVDVPEAYLVDVLAAIRDLRELDGDRLVDVIAVEGITRPSPHVTGRGGRGRAIADPSGLLGTAHVIGAITSRAWGIPVVKVRPAGNGSRPLGAYPDALVSAAERRAGDWRLRVGTGRLRHARSAWDAAQAAPLHLAANGRTRP